MKLTEDQHRAKLIELLDRMSDRRMNLWIVTGTLSHVLDGDLIERLMREEIPRRSHEVQRYWLGMCNCHGQLN
jgi:hypothetical protein